MSTEQKFKTFQEVSKEGFGPLPLGRKLTTEDLMLGAMLRIADAMEGINDSLGGLRIAERAGMGLDPEIDAAKELLKRPLVEFETLTNQAHKFLNNRGIHSLEKLLSYATTNHKIEINKTPARVQKDIDKFLESLKIKL